MKNRKLAIHYSARFLVCFCVEFHGFRKNYNDRHHKSISIGLAAADSLELVLYSQVFQDDAFLNYLTKDISKNIIVVCG